MLHREICGIGGGLRSGMRIASKTSDSTGTANDLVECVFLSPEWISQVARAVESAREASLYLQNLLADYTLGVTYVIRNIPAQLGHWYGGGPEAVVFVRLDKGTVRRIAVGGKPQKTKVDVMATMDYATAKKLIAGQIRPAATLLSGRIKAVPRNDFLNWPKLATKSIVTANQILKIARTVPTVFA